MLNNRLTITDSDRNQNFALAGLGISQGGSAQRSLTPLRENG
jgi:hypothetical protein